MNIDQSKNKMQKKGLTRLLEIAGTKKWWLLGSMCLAVLASFAQFIPYIAVYKIMMELARSASHPQLIDKNFIWHWGYLSLWSLFIYGILIYSSLMLSHIAAFNILYELRIALSRKLVRLPLGFFSKRASGEIKKIMSEDVERTELFVAHHIPDVTTAIVFPLIILSYLFYKDWQLATIILAVFIFAFAIQSSMMINRKSKKLYDGYHEALSHMNKSIVEYVRGMQVVKIFNHSADVFKRLNDDIFAFRDFSVGITVKFSYIYTGFLTLLSSTLLFLIPGIVIKIMKVPSYPAYIPTVFLFLILSTGVFFPLLKLMWMGSLMTQNSIGVGYIDDILNKDEITEPSHPQHPSHAAIEFRDVSFSYNDVPILKNISFKACPNNVTALVGPSGAGKSTIGMLTARFWDVSSGEIRIGDVPIKNIKTEELMNYISFVFQDNMLFFDTIEENIRMGNKTATHQEVVEAAKAAQCHQFINKLEHQYNTLVGEGGIYLSGGEQQRIALARAILKNAPIVILDEATAFADPENESKILDSFAHLIKGKTVLVIAHRLSTITNAEQILVVNNGVICEQGTHTELLAMRGVYKRMWDTYSYSRNWTLEIKGERTNEAKN
jgi:ATP-binding cassette subfamily B protein IrtA